MSQQDFEPQQAPDKEIYQPQYPYNWSKRRAEGMPRDEPPGSYREYQGQRGFQDDQTEQGQVPWWARPQPNQGGPFIFAVIVALAILVTFILGALGLAGAAIGGVVHIIGIMIGVIFALILFAILLVLLMLRLIWRALGRTFGFSWRDMRQSARRFRRGPW